MNIETLIVLLIIGVVLFFTARSLKRMWRGDSSGGCSSCPGCGDRNQDNACMPPAFAPKDTNQDEK